MMQEGQEGQAVPLQGDVVPGDHHRGKSQLSLGQQLQCQGYAVVTLEEVEAEEVQRGFRAAWDWFNQAELPQKQQSARIFSEANLSGSSLVGYVAILPFSLLSSSSFFTPLFGMPLAGLTSPVPARRCSG